MLPRNAQRLFDSPRCQTDGVSLSYGMRRRMGLTLSAPSPPGGYIPDYKHGWACEANTVYGPPLNGDSQQRNNNLPGGPRPVS